MSAEIRQKYIEKKKIITGTDAVGRREYTQLTARQNKNSTKPEQMV
jgi:hypothetical protein